MDDDGAAEARFEAVFNPSELLFVPLVRLVDLFSGHLLLLLFVVLSRVLLLFGCALGLVLHVEADGQVEIALNGTALVLALECVEDLDVDFGAVESTITCVDSPGTTETVQRSFKSSFCFVPKVFTSESILRTSRQLKLEFKAKLLVNIVQKVKRVCYLLSNLIFSTENMTIILLESAHTGQTSEST